MLKTSREIGDIGSANRLREQFVVGAEKGAEGNTRFDIHHSRNCRDLLDTCVVENTSSISLATSAPVAFVTRAAPIRSDETAQPSAEHLNLVEEIKRFEALKHVALQTETE